LFEKAKGLAITEAEVSEIQEAAAKAAAVAPA